LLDKILIDDFGALYWTNITDSINKIDKVVWRP